MNFWHRGGRPRITCTCDGMGRMAKMEYPHGWVEDYVYKHLSTDCKKLVIPKDGKNYYSWDGGKTWEPLTDEEFRQRSPLVDVEWWTYEEYAVWLENEKKKLQAMLGEKGWTGGRSAFIWTQEIIDETIAMYERILQEIKEGKLYPKSVGGDTNSLLISGGAGSVFGSARRFGPTWTVRSLWTWFEQPSTTT